MMVRSTGKVPAPGFGLASEPIALWGESAAKSLLGAAPLGALFPPPYPPPPPQAASPSSEDSIAESTSSLRFDIVLLLPAKTSLCGLTAQPAASFRRERLFAGKEHKQSLIRDPPSQCSCNKT